MRDCGRRTDGTVGDRSAREAELLTRLRSFLRRGGPGGGPATADVQAAEGEKVSRLRRRLAKKDRELEELRARLARAEGAVSGLKEPPFFVVGRAKSGTSWLMRILNAHPEILCRGEGRFFGRDFIREDYERGQRGRIQPSSLYRALLEAHYLEAWIERSVWTRGDDVGEHLDNLTRLSTDYFLGRRLARSGKRIVGDKTPFLGEDVLGEISEISPGARVVHIFRDGRDVAVSLLHHRWNHASDAGGIYDLSPEELARRDTYRKDPEAFARSGGGLFPPGMLVSLAAGWKAQIGKAVKDGPSLLGERYAEVRYEDLLERPEEEVERLLRFLGADAEGDAVGHCVEAGSFEEWAEGRERGSEEPTAFLRKGIAGDWKNVFTEADKRDFKAAAGNLLIELGYEKDDRW